MRNLALCAALIGGLAIIAFSEHQPQPASASPAPQIDQAQLAKIKADLQSEFSSGLKQIADRLDSLPSAGDFAELKRQVNTRPAPTAYPTIQPIQTRQPIFKRQADELLERTYPSKTGMTIGTPPAGSPTVSPTAGGALQFVSFPLRGSCGPNGCGAASQPTNVGRGVPVVRQWRPFRGRFSR